ncbi:unnamed protein product [Allacma fusca]|uniref:Uncharacterized protein n=1 Tax=Allacma fusca TaxID=39272 RepID=A0A8J2Q2R1_9HEXA|nr:unnamed protein product [Allacma fusca]
MPGGPPSDLPGELIVNASTESRYLSSDSEAQRTKKIKRWKRFVRTSESQGCEDSSSGEEEPIAYEVLNVPIHEEMESNIFVGTGEALDTNDDVEVVFPRGERKKLFTVGPRELPTLFQFPELTQLESSKRQPRARQNAELMTSDQNMEKLTQKQSRKKSKSSDESADERRLTRSLTDAEKVTLRSGRKIK